MSGAHATKSPAPSIQSFFPLIAPPSTGKHLVSNGSSIVQSQDTGSRIDIEGLRQSDKEYAEGPISDVRLGSRLVKFQGRIVNYTAAVLKGKQYTRPWHLIVLKDDTAAIAVC